MSKKYKNTNFQPEIHSFVGKCESPVVSQPNGGPKAKCIKLVLAPGLQLCTLKKRIN